ncbi:MAG: cobalamin-binding protein [bacterium]
MSPSTLRVVSTTCSNTEILCALGCADMLVGVDDYSDYPEDAVARLPRVGPDLDVDVSRVKALAPDLVLASLTVPGHERVVDALLAAGLRVLAPEPVSLADVAADIREIARAVGVEARGEEVAARFTSALVPRPARGLRPSVLVEWWPKPVISPGRFSWVTDLLELAGGRNPLGGEPIKSRPLDVDELRRLDPDAIVISWCGIDPSKYREEVVLERRGCENLRAVRGRRVFPIPEAHLGRPGPRLVDGLADLARVVAACPHERRRRLPRRESRR